jgi:P27 family predicted phage terminase small subunit
MAGQRQPIDLVIAKGRKHFTKADIAKRRSQEINVPFKDIEAPPYLSEELKSEFYDLAYKLLDIGIMTELDENCLAQYLISQDLYLKYTELITEAIELYDLDGVQKLAVTQDKFYRQCRTAATDLGLTISSRCKLVVPETPNDEEL